MNAILGERFTINNNMSLENINDSKASLVLLGNIEGDLTENELSSLRNFINSGGKLFLAQGKINPDLKTWQGSVKQSNIYSLLNEYGLNIEENLILDKNGKKIIATTGGGKGLMSLFNRIQIDYPLIPTITEFESYDNLTTGLEGLQAIQIAFPSEIIFTDTTNTFSFMPLLKTSNNSATMTDFFNLGALPEVNPMLNNLNEDAKVIAAKLLVPNGGEIVLITDSEFFDDNNLAHNVMVRSDINENYTMIENIIDVMLGDSELVALRSREIISRPFIDEAQGKENSSLRTKWKWINILLPSLLIVAYGLIRRKSLNKKSKYIMEYYG
jgi:ABC-type uncharacterized transport system involved in gliding motility auxiliary subunit